MVLNECEACGTRFAHDLKVCPHCGAPLTVPVLAGKPGPAADPPKGSQVVKNRKGDV